MYHDCMARIAMAALYTTLHCENDPIERRYWDRRFMWHCRMRRMGA